MRRFSFFQRNGIFYRRLFKELTGKWSTAKSTGTRSKDDAYLAAVDWLKSGIPTSRARMLRPARENFALDMILTYIRGTCTLSDAERILGALNAKGFTEGAVLKGPLLQSGPWNFSGPSGMKIRVPISKANSPAAGSFPSATSESRGSLWESAGFPSWE